METPELETLLRAAPQPAAPPTLAQRLRQQVTLPPLPTATAAPTAGRLRADRETARPWWWMALLAGGLAAGAATVVWQQAEIQNLKAQVEVPSVVPEPVAILPKTATEDPRAEIERLRTEIAQRLSDAQTAENSGVGDGSPASLTLSAEDAAWLDAAKARAASIQCVNNMKYIALGVRVYATDHDEKFPADIDMIHAQLSTPKLLTCPGDPNRQAAADWAAYSPSNLSYEYLAPDGSEADPTRVLTRCLIHGNIGLCDGSVQMNSTNRPLKVVNRQGKLYFE